MRNENNTPTVHNITVITPNFRRPDLISNLIKDLETQKQVRLQIIVVDDCSKDGSVEKIRLEHPLICVLENERNQGPTVARNKGIRMAENEIIIGIDSDVTLPDPYLLNKIATELQRLPPKHAFALRVMSKDGQTDDVPRWWHPHDIEKFAETEFETIFFSGTAFAFWKRDLINIGMFQEEIFQYYEEDLLAARFIDYGGTIKYRPEFKVLHHPGNRPAFSKHRTYHSPRSQVIYAYCILPKMEAIFFITTRLGNGLIKSIRQGGIKEFLKGSKDGFAAIYKATNIRKPLTPNGIKKIKGIRSAARST